MPGEIFSEARLLSSDLVPSAGSSAVPLLFCCPFPAPVPLFTVSFVPPAVSSPYSTVPSLTLTPLEPLTVTAATPAAVAFRVMDAVLADTPT